MEFASNRFDVLELITPTLEYEGRSFLLGWRMPLTWMAAEG